MGQKNFPKKLCQVTIFVKENFKKNRGTFRQKKNLPKKEKLARNELLTKKKKKKISQTNFCQKKFCRKICFTEKFVQQKKYWQKQIFA